MGIKQTEAGRQRKNQDWMRQPSGIDERSVSAKPTGLSLLLKNLMLLTTGGLAGLGLLFLISIWHTGGQFFDQLRASFTVAEPPAKVDLRSLVVQQVRGASELTTAVYSMESVVPASRERTLGDYVIGKTTLLYIAHGEVRAGVNLATLQPGDLQVVGDAMAIRLPPPQILDSKIDVNRSKVYDYDRGFMGLGPDVAPELQELAQRETLTKVVEAACADGILQAANDRAKLAVEQLLSTAGYRQLTVETQPAAANACQPPTATPALVVPAPSPVTPDLAVPSAVPSPIWSNPESNPGVSNPVGP